MSVITYSKLISKGVCPFCKKKNAEDSLYCKVCKSKFTKQNKESYHERKKLGLCNRCFKAFTIDGNTLCEECKDITKTRQNTRRRLLVESGFCVQCQKVKPVEGKTRCGVCAARHVQYSTDQRLVLRDEAFEAYGGAFCACCGETTKLFLQLDHINNDGAKHREDVGIGNTFLKWLKDNNYPPIMQVLCANCNWGKQLNGGICPHQTVKT